MFHWKTTYSYTLDANSPSASGGSAAISVRTESSTESPQNATQSPNRHSAWLRSSSQPATCRNTAFNEISDGNWQYCIASPNAIPAVKGFGNVPIVSYEEIEQMGDRKLKMCAVTWNVNEKNSKVLNHLAKKLIEKGNDIDSDIFFISLQEIPSTATTFHEDALKILEPVFKEHSLYLSHRAWSQMVIVFLRQKHLRYAIRTFSPCLLQFSCCRAGTRFS
uniref:Uncharacterized protein n=1 Tax=Caenorhabditis japonica TaxID=281687 RepID=A0A8R1E968_CAEJA